MAETESDASPDWATDPEEYSGGETESEGSMFSDIPQYCEGEDIAIDAIPGPESNNEQGNAAEENEPPRKKSKKAETKVRGRRGGRRQSRERGLVEVAPSCSGDLVGNLSNSEEASEERESEFLTGQHDPNFHWYLNPPTGRSKSSKQRRNRSPGVLAEAKEAVTPLDMWKCLFTDAMLKTVTDFTNIEITKVPASQQSQITYNRATDPVEISAVIGLLFYAGVTKQSKVHTEELWGNSFAPSIYRLTMPERRFLFLLKCLRFDDRATRSRREKSDRFAAIRDLWTSFVNNTRRCYYPNEICTIDEHKIPFKGRCKFSLYLSIKPHRYGFKFITINDSKTNYLFDAMPYLGKDPERKNRHEPVANYFVKKLVESIRHSGRTIVTDDWFTSTDLFVMLKKEFGLNALGTIRPNKKEIPLEFIRYDKEKSRRYCYHDDLTLLSYTPVKNKILLLLSNGPNSNFDENSIISFYNKFKGATEAYDDKCKLYTVARRTRRWPLRVFYSILDFSNLNANILYNLKNRNNKMIRKDFIKEIAMSLVKPMLAVRSKTLSLRANLKKHINFILDGYERPAEQEAVIRLDKKKRCAFCDPYEKAKTKYACSSCHKPMCTYHRCSLCVECKADLE